MVRVSNALCLERRITSVNSQVARSPVVGCTFPRFPSPQREQRLKVLRTRRHGSLLLLRGQTRAAAVASFWRGELDYTCVREECCKCCDKRGTSVRNGARRSFRRCWRLAVQWCQYDSCTVGLQLLRLQRHQLASLRAEHGAFTQIRGGQTSVLTAHKTRHNTSTANLTPDLKRLSAHHIMVCRENSRSFLSCCGVVV